MNKTEALVALLEKMRQWEEPASVGDAAAELGAALVALDRNFYRLKDLSEDEHTPVGPEQGAALICIGAAALYLLVDETEAVTGQSLDEWLAYGPKAPEPERPGSPRVPPSLRPVNGGMTLFPPPPEVRIVPVVDPRRKP